jgi:hypothetical protein
MATVFFSYSHKDEALRDELEIALSNLKRSGSIEAWHDRKILAGDHLGGAIDVHLDQAEIILLLISPDFLASNYCYEIEFARAMERQAAGTARVIAVILRPSDWRATPVAQLLVTPKDGLPITKWPNQDDAFLDVTQQIRRALPAVQTSARKATPPPTPEASTKQHPRSSNMRVRQTFSEIDIANFLEESFEFIQRFFEGSLNELEERHSDIQTKLKKIDATCFTSVIYRNGKEVAACTIRQGPAISQKDSITYLSNASGAANRFNESLSVEVGEQSLSLKAMDMGSLTRVGKPGLSQEGAAEFLWSKLLGPLQR